VTEVQHGGHASTLGDHVRVLRRRKWIVIVTTVVVTALALLMSSRQGTSYQASALVLINQVSPGYAVVGGIPRNDPTRQAFSQAVVASGPLIANRVAKLPEFRRNPALLSGGVGVTSSEGSDLLAFHSVAASPEAAVALVNAYATQYLAYSSIDTTRSLRQTRLTIQKQLDQLALEGRQGSQVYATYADYAQRLQIAETLLRHCLNGARRCRRSGRRAQACA